jgi:hypothetical protein
MLTATRDLEQSPGIKKEGNLPNYLPSQQNGWQGS